MLGSIIIIRGHAAIRVHTCTQTQETFGRLVCWTPVSCLQLCNCKPPTRPSRYSLTFLHAYCYMYTYTSDHISRDHPYDSSPLTPVTPVNLCSIVNLRCTSLYSKQLNLLLSSLRNTDLAGHLPPRGATHAWLQFLTRSLEKRD